MSTTLAYLIIYIFFLFDSSLNNTSLEKKTNDGQTTKIVRILTIYNQKKGIEFLPQTLIF